MQRGRVANLFRWPVKSFAGEAVDVLELGPRGAAGDRAHAVFDRHRDAPRRLTARQAPRMLAWSALLEGDPPAATPIVVAPDGRRFDWSDDALPAALGTDLEREVRLVSASPGAEQQQDLPDSVLVTIEATRAAIESELGRPLDLRRFRPNIHLELDADAFAEESWEGRTLRIGEAELELLHPCERCVIPTRDPDDQTRWPGLARWLFSERTGTFGINARPRTTARVAVGDAVEVG